MAKKIRIVLTLQLPAGKATPAPPVGTALGPHGINIVEFTKSYNEKTADKAGQIIPAQITIFEDRSFTFILKTPPAADLLRKAAGVEKGSTTPKRETRRPGHPRPGPRDRRHQDGRPQRQRRRRRDAPDRGHRPESWASRSSASAADDQPTAAPRPRAATTARERGRSGSTRPTGRNQHMASTARSTSRRRSSSTASRSTSRSRRSSSPSRPPSSPFDASIEAHLRLGVDPRHADQMVRGTVVLPHGTGKVVRVAVFAQGEKAQEALRAGADEVGGEDLVKKIEAGWLEFDVAIATPDSMGLVGKLGKILGRRGLMPNPKAGTITFDIERAVRRSRAAASSSASTRRAIVHAAVRQEQLRAAGPASTTWPPWSTRSTGPSRPAPRASTCRSLTHRQHDGPGHPGRRARRPRGRGRVTDAVTTGESPVTRRGGGREARHLTKTDGPATDSLRPRTATTRGS